MRLIANTARFTGFGFPRYYYVAWDYCACNQTTDRFDWKM